MNKTIPIRNIFFHVTKACNLNCKYCYFSANKPLSQELQIEDLAQFWPDLILLSPKKLILTGGEPLLRQDLLEWLQELRKFNLNRSVQVCLNTNGHLLTTYLVRKLVGLVDEVRLSLDGLYNVNDELRGEGNFNAVIKAIECLKSGGFNPKILITVTSKNIMNLAELVEYLLAKGITLINLNYFRPIGRGKHHLDWIVDPDDIKSIMNKLWDNSFKNMPSHIHLENEIVQCHCGVGEYINILPNGDVFPCHVLSGQKFKCGNIKEESILKICSTDGFLADLSRLNFCHMAKQEVRLSELMRPGSCMGEVYAKTKSLPIWQDILK